ncbi:MAG: sodium ion-translocating decarboxylase subunit beta, partial [Oscillospiraceae bacterium]|nr:sodium ion-translocating decarboxylase subunit beta [Oscillospiraceae bacterium]
EPISGLILPPVSLFISLASSTPPAVPPPKAKTPIATMAGSQFLRVQTLYIVGLGLAAFGFSTVGGLLVAKIMYKVTGGKINPLIGSAGVSAVPMAARVSQIEGQTANPKNFLLMHAMGPNVAGVIGSAIAAGFLLKVFGA